jgi:autotransporter-associated beta strand protein
LFFRRPSSLSGRRPRLAIWLGGVAPGGIGDSATFSTIITAPRTATVDSDTTVGTLKFDSPNNYTVAGPHTLTLQAGGFASATINVSNVHGNGAHTISVPITLASPLDIAQDSTGALRLTGPLNDSAARSITKSGSGAVEIAGAPTFGAGTTVSASAGTLRIALTSGSPTIGAGVQVNLTGTATLELAGTVSALSSGPNRANILNNSTASAGVLVSGTNQHVGTIDGNGNMQVAAGRSLTANHIVECSLIIGGTADSPALVTVAALDSMGNSLATASDVRFAAIGEANASSSVVEFKESAGFHSEDAPADGAVASVPAGANSAPETAVPEPSAILMALVALVVSSVAFRRNEVLQMPL